MIAINRKARHDYHVLDTYDAGIALRGSEAKSLREGMVAISDSFAEVYNGEVFLVNLHIAQYKHSMKGSISPKRRRKLLLNKREIKKIYGYVQQKGNTLIPLKLYFNERGFAKVTLGVCRRKRQYDKKEKILKAEVDKKLDRARKLSR
jgi:SsrA-binding protein